MQGSTFRRTIEFIKNQRIRTSHKRRFIGVRDTLIGWFLVTINAVFLEPPYKIIPLEVSFVIFFFSANLFLLFYILIENLFLDNKPFHNFWITNDTETAAKNSHLTIKQRIKWIYFRGLVATGGYICLSLAKIAFWVIDNTSIFGADAIIYAIFAWLLLKEKFTKFHIIGLVLGSTGVFYVLFFDLHGTATFLDGVVAGASALASAIALTIIFFITGVIVRHDTPKRVAFHQCICGLILSVAILIITLVLRLLRGYEIDFSGVDLTLVKNSVLSGILLSIAFIFFLRAFIFTRPIIIAILGYSLNFFTVALESWSLGKWPDENDLISSLLILTGCCFPLFYEHKKEKKSERILNKERTIYEHDLKTELISLREKYQIGKLGKYNYLDEHYEFNKILLEYSNIISNSIINSIEISQSSLIFSIGEFTIKLETDGSMRSVPFEILSFGAYEPEDEAMCFDLIKDGDTIFDAGAHIGWYSLNFAKRFPQAKIHAFEPVSMTYEYLMRNIAMNDVSNIVPLKLGLFNEEKDSGMFYFKGGSAIASIKNLIGHKKATQIECEFTTLDKYTSENKCSIDFLKCDVEGSELFVLMGGEHAIRTQQPIIFLEIYEEWCDQCEYKGMDIVNFLKERGYEIFQAKNNGLAKCTHFDFSNDERYNYFCLSLEKHRKIIKERAT